MKRYYREMKKKKKITNDQHRHVEELRKILHELTSNDEEENPRVKASKILPFVTHYFGEELSWLYTVVDVSFFPIFHSYV